MFDPDVDIVVRSRDSVVYPERSLLATLHRKATMLSDWKISRLMKRFNSRGQQKHPKQSLSTSEGQDYEILEEVWFRRMLYLERKRAERSRKSFLLMLLAPGKLLETDQRQKLLSDSVSALLFSIRETDVWGWYEENSILGVIFTETDRAEKSSLANVIRAKVMTVLRNLLNAEQLEQIHLSFHFFPEDWDKQDVGRSVGTIFYPELSKQDNSRGPFRFVKRTMDIVGSALALTALSPLFVFISLTIKITSKGPILFRQERVGQYGVTFTFLKFRSMKVCEDASIHEEYVKGFIAGKIVHASPQEMNQSAVYKITEDPRVTAVGKFLRKSSLDELPQFFNVLRGEMSLVGPRPPIPYELESYDLWHRRRVLEAKPGITGLWQVSGRSKTRFDDMVRLDLRYAKARSIWLDTKILLKTPRAVFSGEGAY